MRTKRLPENPIPDSEKGSDTDAEMKTSGTAWLSGPDLDFLRFHHGIHIAVISNAPELMTIDTPDHGQQGALPVDGRIEKSFCSYQKAPLGFSVLLGAIPASQRQLQDGDLG